MKNIEKFIFELRLDGIDLSCANGSIQIKGRQGKITSEILANLTANKQHLIDYLQTSDIQYYPISTLQKRMFKSYYSSSNKEHTHNLYSIFSLDEKVNTKLLKMCFQRLIDEHEILRTGYQMKNNQMVQAIYNSKSLDYQNYELKDTDIEKWIAEHGNKPFNIESGEVFRIILGYNSKTNYRLLIVMVHHIACDFDSLHILLDIVSSYYKYYSSQVIPQLNLSQQYKQFILTERDVYKSDAYNASLAYWKSQLDNDIIYNVFNEKNETVISKQFIGKSNIFIDNLDTNYYQKIINITKHESVTSHNLLLSLFEIIIAAYSKQKKFNIGLPFTKRKNDQQQMLGMFIDTYWIKADLEMNRPFSELVKQVKRLTLDMMSYINCSFFNILEELEIMPNHDSFPIFNICFNWIKLRSGVNPNILVQENYGSRNSGFNTAPYELMLTALEENQQIKLLWIYSSLIFDEKDIKRMSNSLHELIDAISNNLQLDIHSLQQSLTYK